MTWHPVKRDRPCAICSKSDWCGWTDDGAARCMRIADPPPGWRAVKQKDAEGGTVFRPGETAAVRNGTQSKARTGAAARRDWRADADRFASALDSARRDELAGLLGVRADTIPLIGVGWNGSAWTCPERAGDGEIIGISTRRKNGAKKALFGGKRGLIVPANLADLPDPVLVVEGASDVLTVLTLGLAAVGRPSNAGGSEHLAELLRGRDVIVVGENDRKADGRWPGRDGAQAVAAHLAGAWGRSVRCAMTPDGAKDVRAWLAGRIDVGLVLSDLGACRAAGADLMRGLIEAAAEARSNAAATEEPWPEPIPLTGATPAPEFPMQDALPDSCAELRDFMAATAEALQVPIELPAMLFLPVAATSIARKCEVEPMVGWREPAALWTLTLLESGNRKSAALSAMAEPIEQWEAEETTRLGPEIASDAEQRRIDEARLYRLRTQAANGKAAATEARALAVELAERPMIRAPRLVTSDTTTEALAALLFENGERALVACAEGDPLDVLLGRYAERGAPPNFGMWLAGHSGDPVRIDRLSRPPIHLKRPALSVALVVQPEASCGLYNSRAARGRGLLARFLACAPRSTMGRRAINPEPVPDRLRLAYHRTIRRLLDWPLERGRTPTIVRLSAEARELFDEFRAQLEPELGPDGDLVDFADWGGKLAGAVARIALILHAVGGGDGDGISGIARPINVATMKAALWWAAFLGEHTPIARAIVGTDAHIGTAKRILRWLSRGTADRFSVRDAFRAVEGTSVPRVEDLHEALGLLEIHEFIRPIERARASEATARRRGRPPSPEYVVNPRWRRGAS